MVLVVTVHEYNVCALSVGVCEDFAARPGVVGLLHQRHADSALRPPLPATAHIICPVDVAGVFDPGFNALMEWGSHVEEKRGLGRDLFFLTRNRLAIMNGNIEMFSLSSVAKLKFSRGNCAH